MATGTLRAAFIHAPVHGNGGASISDRSFGSSLGAASVAAALVEAGLCGAGDILALGIPDDCGPEEACRRIEAFSPDIVGLSLYCWNSPRLLRVARLLRGRGYKGSLVAGGPDAEGVAAREADSGLFDAIFLGEAEKALVDWLEGGRKKPAGGALRCPPPAVDLLASPWLKGMMDPRPGDSAAWELTRGCPYHCAYCYEGRGSNRLRRIPMARLEAEVEIFLAAGVGEVFVLDPTFNADQGRALEILRFLARKAGDRIRWNFEVRAELLSEAQARAFAALPCSLQIGLQSADPGILAGIGRTMDKEKFVKNLRILDRHGIVYGLDLIYGLPGDSLAGFLRSLDFALFLGPNHLDIFGLSILPGTELWDRREELGLVADYDPPYALKEHRLASEERGFSAADMEEARGIAQAADLFYSRGRAVPWFRSIAAAAKAKPSALIRGFSRFAMAAGPDARHRAIEELQIAYVEGLFTLRKNGNRLSGLAKDMIRYFGAWSRAFAEGEKTILAMEYPPEALELAAAEGMGAAERMTTAAGLGGGSTGTGASPWRIEIGPSRKGPMVRVLKGGTGL